MTFKTEQEQFWAEDFGHDYISRNDHKYLIAGNLNLFSQILSKTRNVNSIIEFGSNIGNNLMAISQLFPDCELSAVEINKEAADTLKKKKIVKVYNESIIDFKPDYKRDFVFTKGVLIHINPDKLQKVYQNMYETSSKYILVVEYFNPAPVSIPYRGHSERLFKRDFAGDLLDKYSDLALVDYGCTYSRDNNFKNYDDFTWFLLEKV